MLEEVHQVVGRVAAACGDFGDGQLGGVEKLFDGCELDLADFVDNRMSEYFGKPQLDDSGVIRKNGCADRP